MTFALGARAISAVESEAASFPSCSAWSTLRTFSQHPETGVLPIPNRTQDLTHQRSLLHAEQNAPKAGLSISPRARGPSTFVAPAVASKRCTSLHMAARRDNVEVAGTLLDCGADIEARDSVGDTPLRRSVNCNQVGVATLLLARGADIHSIGSKGITPLLAARTITMKRLLQSTVDGRTAEADLS
jgi:hypothetical protein